MSKAFAIVVGLSLFSGLALLGCDREVEKHETIEQKSNGTRVEKRSETKETPSGGVVHEEEKKVTNPNNP